MSLGSSSNSLPFMVISSTKLISSALVTCGDLSALSLLSLSYIFCTASRSWLRNGSLKFFFINSISSRILMLPCQPAFLIRASFSFCVYVLTVGALELPAYALLPAPTSTSPFGVKSMILPSVHITTSASSLTSAAKTVPLIPIVAFLVWSLNLFGATFPIFPVTVLKKPFKTLNFIFESFLPVKR